MWRLALILFLTQFLKVDSKFYETDVAPYGIGGQYGSYSTQEYDPEGSYPYGLSYKRYPNIPYKGGRALEFEEPLSGPIGLKYGNADGLGYPGRVGYGGYYGSAGTGYPIGINKNIGFGYGPRQSLGYSPISHHGLGPVFPHGRLDFYGQNSPIGVSQIDNGIYSDGKQNLVGHHYKNVQGLNGESLNHGDVGYNKGDSAYKDAKADSVHYIDSDGLNKGHHEGKAYSGGEHFDSEGKHGNERVLNANHNKGHNIKGFKKSHHLDETGKTEEFFDADHDAGGNYAFDGRFGKFGEQGGNSYKGGFNDGRFKSGEATKQGHYDNNYFLDKAQGGSGKFGENKFAQNEEGYGLNKGFGEHDLSGHHENSNIYKKYPIGGGYGGYEGGYYKRK